MPPVFLGWRYKGELYKDLPPEMVEKLYDVFIEVFGCKRKVKPDKPEDKQENK